MSCSSSRHFVDCSDKKISSEEFYSTLYSICEEWTTHGMNIFHLLIEHDLIACTANISSIIYHSYMYYIFIISSSYKGLNCVNWVGFYFVFIYICHYNNR